MTPPQSMSDLLLVLSLPPLRQEVSLILERTFGTA